MAYLDLRKQNLLTMQRLRTYLGSHKAASIVFVGFAVLFWLVFAYSTRRTSFPNDDTTLPLTVAEYANIIDFLTAFYAEWAGRLVPYFFVYIFMPLTVSPVGIWAWRLASFAAYIATVLLGFRLYRLLSPDDRPVKDALLLALIMGALLLFDLDTLDAVYWVTCSMFYFWTTPFFLAAVYTPAHLLACGRLPRPWAVAGSGAATLLTCIAQEQFALSLCALLAVGIVYAVVAGGGRRKPRVVPLLAFAALAVAAFVWSLNAPGNAVRAELDLNYWLPDLYTVPFAVRAEACVRWFMDSMINQTGFLLPLIWLLLAALLLHSCYGEGMGNAAGGLSQAAPADGLPQGAVGEGADRKARAARGCKIALAVLFVALAVTGIFFDRILVLTVLHREFYPVWGFVGRLRDWLAIAFYFVALALTLGALIWACLPGRTPSRDASATSGASSVAVLLAALLIIACATIAAMWLTATMYASLHRTAYVASVLLTAIAVVLASRCYDQLRT